MTAFPRAPVAFAEGKPGNVFICYCSRTGPGSGSKDRSRPDSFVGRAGRGQGNPGQGTGQAVGIPQISTGDLLRANVARDRTGPGSQGDHGARRTGSRFAGQRDGGGAACSSRTPPTATFWTGFRARWAGRLAGWPPGGAGPRGLPVVAVSIQVDYNQLLRRITGRRNCPVCQTIYNVYVNPPQKDGFCDVEGAALVQRADDTEEVFKERMRAYEALTAPVVEHYRAFGTFCGSGWRPADRCNRGRNCCRRRAVAPSSAAGRRVCACRFRRTMRLTTDN
jgi:adenylate kinase